MVTFDDLQKNDIIIIEIKNTKSLLLERTVEDRYDREDGVIFIKFNGVLYDYERFHDAYSIEFRLDK